MKRFVGLVLATALASTAALSCGPDRPADSGARREAQPQWQDVFDGTPEMYAVVRPQAIKRDTVYGSFWKTLLRLAQARSEMRGVTSVEALEGCEEIIIGIRRDGTGEDAAMVFRGVPASLDPQRMTNVSGAPMLHLVDPKARVPEYQFLDRKNLEGNGSLFVLPDRTWVGTMGEARARARQAFAAPFGRPAPKVDADALASVRFDAAAFFSGPRFERSPMIGPLTRKLRSVTLAVMPGSGGVVATLQYQDEDASAWAEMHAKRVLEELAKVDPGASPEAPAGPVRPGRRPDAVRSGRATLAWLRDARVGHDGNSVIVKLPVPPRLLEELPSATGADLPF